jgi:hypothetical protein
MNLSDLRAAHTFANRSGIKAIVYGAPGSGKTPVAATSPRPVMLVTEPGMLSMRGVNIPCYEAYTSNRIDGFFDWWFKSAEIKQFDTLIIDSSSQLAEIYLQDAKTKNAHGLKAYGTMGEDVMEHLRKLFFQQEKNIYLIAKEGTSDNMKRPFYPGKYLNVEIPHLYDMILHLGIHNIPGEGQHRSFQCHQTIDILTRDRSGRLNMFEPPSFGEIVRKAIA